MCGEKRAGSWTYQNTQGSPPRVRGKVGFFGRPARLTGITPACAGKSDVRFSRLLVLRDHPRVCGEKSLPTLNHADLRGSPPRVRGKVCIALAIGYTARITPACAGKRNQRNAAGGDNQDHPRVCGEKAGRKQDLQSMQGSPPRVRGKVVDSGFHFFRNQDHPRVCGEKRNLTMLTDYYEGSPPRVRGKD